MAGGDFTRIAGNVAALQALNSLSMINNKLGISQLRLATGKRINSAADDAAGLGIATKLDFKQRGLGQALSNIGDAMNLIATSEGHLSNMKDILAVMKTKAEQAANDTLGADERTAILTEVQKLNAQIDAEQSQAKWSTNSLLGTSANSLSFMIGVQNTDVLSFNVAGEVFGTADTTSKFDSAGLGVDARVAAAAAVAGQAGVGSAVNGISGTVGTSVNSQPLADAIATGHFSVNIAFTGAGAGNGGSLVATLVDANGTALTVDLDGSGSAGGVGTAATMAVATATATTTVDFGNGIKVDVAGLDETKNQSATYSFNYTSATSGGANAVDTIAHAQSFMTSIDSASTKVSKALSYIGSLMNRLSYQEQSVTVAQTNTSAAYNRIMNADMAFEQVEATKYSILQQTATAMLGQANTRPQNILSLFR
ncbi:MAG: flagellin [Chloroflexi bacterium]|nr:flagellin [Chloroflexota bacterium]